MKPIIKLNPTTYQVCVFHEEGMWIGVCDELGLVTEAPTCDALIERARQIAPDLLAANPPDEDPEMIRLSFLQTQQEFCSSLLNHKYLHISSHCVNPRLL